MNEINNFESAKQFLYSHTKSKKYDLTKIKLLFEEMGDFYKDIPVIHVVGTNGKGSTSSSIASILFNSGYKTGLFTSPHLVNLRERIVVDGNWINEQDFIKATREVFVSAEKLKKKIGEYPTFFELIYATAMVHFKNLGVEIAVLEAGLGGRLDATNVSNSILTIITKIALDHTKTLGNTITKIAFEKAQVIRKNGIVVSSPQRKNALEVIQKTASLRNAKIEIFRKEKISKINKIYLENNRIFQEVFIKEFGDVKMSLIGNHQIENAKNVISACNYLNNMGFNISKGSILKGFKNNLWPGRIEYISADNIKEKYRENLSGIYIDGAHNPNGMMALEKSLNSMKLVPLPIIFGVLGDKSLNGMSRSLKNISTKIYATRPDSPRALPSEDLSKKLKELSLNVIYYNNDLEATLNNLLSGLKCKTNILICGSLYLIGEYKKIISKKISEVTFF